MLGLLLASCSSVDDSGDPITPNDTATRTDPTRTDPTITDSGTTETTPTIIEQLDPYVQPQVWAEVDPQQDKLIIYYQGALADRSSATLHYGYNGWNTQSHDQGAAWSETTNGDTFYFWEVAMQADGDGRVAEIPLPADARAVHFVVTDPNTGEWDSNNGLDYHWGLEFPYIGPILSWGPQTTPDDGFTVTWETSVPCLGVVEWGTTQALGNYAVGQAFGTLHHVPLIGLGPDTTVYYRVYDSLGQQSAVFSSTTLDPDAEQLTFAALSDMQDTGESQRWLDVSAELGTHDFRFALVAGDMPSDDGPGQWWTFFDKAGDLFAERPIVPAVGNHDTPTTGHDSDTSSFLRYFPVGDVPWYALDAGPAGFVILSTEVADELAPGGDQYQFAEAALSVDTNPWTFVSFHVPTYNVGVRHVDEVGTARDLTALFDGEVDWVVAGHEHLYQRMVPLRYNAVTASAYGRGPKDGVGHLVLPPAGNYPESVIVGPEDTLARYRDRLAFPPVPDGDVVASEIGFSIIELDGESFSLQTWGLGTFEVPAAPHLRDELSYIRP